MADVGTRNRRRRHNRNGQPRWRRERRSRQRQPSTFGAWLDEMEGMTDGN